MAIKTFQNRFIFDFSISLFGENSAIWKKKKQKKMLFNWCVRATLLPACPPQHLSAYSFQGSWKIVPLVQLP
jgi:hypothetical protein